MRKPRHLDVQNYDVSEKKMLQDNNKLQATLILFIFIKMFYYSRIGGAQSTKYFLLVSVIIATTVITELLFYVFIKKIPLLKSIDIIKLTNPQLTALVIASAINYGFDFSPVILCTFVGILISRLFLNEYKYHIICSPAFVIVLLHSTFTSVSINTTLDGPIDIFLMNLFNSNNQLSIFSFSNLNGYISTNQFPYLSLSLISSTLLFIILSLFIFKLLNLNYGVTLKIYIFLFIMSYSFMGFFNSTSNIGNEVIHANAFLNYVANISESLMHFMKSILFFAYLVFGPTSICILIFTSYTKALPETRIAKLITSFIIALVIFYTKIFTNNSYGFFYGLVIINLLTPMLDETIICTQFNRNITILTLLVLSLLCGFIAFFISMTGV